MRLARGAGLAGMGGMRPRHAAWRKPLLEATRHDIEHDLRAAGIAWREDATNRDPAYTRNRVRHQVVPALLAALRGGRDHRAARRARPPRGHRRRGTACRARRAGPAVRAALAGSATRADGRRAAGCPRAGAAAAGGAPRGRGRGVAAGEPARARCRWPCATRSRAIAGGRGGRRWALPGGAWAEIHDKELCMHPPGPESPGREPLPRASKGRERRPTKSAGDAILPARKLGRRRPAMDGSPVHRDAGPDAPMDSARRNTSGPERTP